MAAGMDRGDLQLIAQELERILGAVASDGSGNDAAIWNTISDNGYPRLCAAEEHGGFGARFGDAADLARLAGRDATPFPLADTMLAAGLLSACGVEPPDERIALADPIDEGAPIAHAMQSDAVLLVNDGVLRLAPLDPDNLVPIAGAEDGAARANHAALDTIISGDAPDWLTPETFRALAALMRATQMAGAMQAALDLTLGYTQGREQFGRPLSKFQAIQHHLADIACETAAASAAVELAADALNAGPYGSPHAIEQIAIAKIRCGEAASRVTAAAHQAHGAMGFTREYALGRYTRRLWQWQDEFGNEAEWAIRLGEIVLADAQPALWPRISAPI